MTELEPYTWQEGDPWPVYMSDQADDWVWYPDGKARKTFSPPYNADNQAKYYYDFQMVAVKPLPPCQLCTKEVKPGEDLCWNCLGETMPLDITDSWYLYTQENYSGQTVYNNYPVSVGTTTNVLTFTAATSTVITAVSMPATSTTFTFSPPITMVNGDTLQIKLNGTIV